MASKLKSLLGLAGEEAPKAGHWMTTMREASQLPATQPTVNESVVNEMLNRPVDRRAFMEGTKNAATALSMGNKLGALADLVPETAAPVRAATEPAYGYIMNLVDRLAEKMPESHKASFIEQYDSPIGDVIGNLEDLGLQNLKLTKPGDQKQSVDEIIDYLLKDIGTYGDDSVESTQDLFTVMDSLGMVGHRHKEIPDAWRAWEADGGTFE